MRDKRTAPKIALALALGVAAPALASDPVRIDPPAGAPCAEPEAVREYGFDSIAYTMEIDLGGCPWWDGSAIEMSGTLTRFDGIQETGALHITVCGSAAPTPAPPAQAPSRTGGARAHGADERPAAAPRADRPRHGTCSIRVELEHLPLDRAHYTGEITFPGPDGERAARFDAECRSLVVTGGCDD